MIAQIGHADLVNKINRRAQADTFSDGRCAGFKPQGRVSIGRAVCLYIIDHIPASKEGRQICPNLCPAPADTNAAWAIELMS